MVETTLGIFMPILSFLLVFIIMYALLLKTKILGENQFVIILISFIIAIIFITFSSVRQYIQTVTPWFVVLLVSVFFILLLIGFTQKDLSVIMKPGFTWVFIIILIIIFLVSAIKVFNPVLSPYLPGGEEAAGEPFLLRVKHVVFSPQILGALLLLAVAAVTAWVLSKK